jgi:hypothetical protein
MKNIHPLRAARRKAGRLAKLQAKPGEQPICLFCGCAEPMLLRPITKRFFKKHRRFFEEHHVFGWMLDSGTTLALCFNCHALVTEGLRQAGVEMKRETDPLKFAQAIFRSQSVHLRILGEACWKFANQLDEESQSPIHNDTE